MSAQLNLGSSVSNVVLQYEPETITQKNRIEADGGTIIDLTKMNSSIYILKSLGIYGNCKLFCNANFGVKKDGSNYVSKLYDVSGNNKDLMAGGLYPPVWSLENGIGVITFNGINNYIEVSSPISAAPFTTSFNVNPITVGAVTWSMKSLNTNWDGWYLASGNYTVVCSNDWGGVTGASLPSYLQDVWNNMYLVEVNSSLHKVYSNGNIGIDGTGTVVPNMGAYKFCIGAAEGSNIDNFANFLFKSTCLYDVALTSEQITILSNIGI